MRFNEKQLRIMRRLAIGATVYQNYHLRGSLFRDQFEDAYKALLCFVQNYAYERQGAARAYPVVARMSLERLFPRNLVSVTMDHSTKAWKLYKEIAKRDFNNLKVNDSHNPMNSDRGILTTMATHDVSNLVLYVKELIEKGNTAKAHDFIGSIRGVGSKIAPFYLRDIVYLSDLNEHEVRHPHYLQPIDTWLDQALAIIFQDKAPRKLKDKQRIVVELCEAAGCSAIDFNQGAWVLGSQIARSFKPFKQIADGKNAKAIVEEHILSTKQYITEIERIVNHFS